MQVPGFSIKRTIGRGGMATVYLAVQESLDREVVLKIMNRGKGEGRGFVDRFLNEGRILASLQHPHIITVYDIGVIDDTVWIAMEYVEGGDLKSRIDAGITPAAALRLVRNLAEALGYAHGHGIVHRDVKPANILFRSDSTALLSDFGIAKRVSVDGELTSTGTILGSPFYMSPEQAEGLSVDGRADIYSLGVILFEMLAGHRPYLGDTAIKVIMQHVQAPVPLLPEHVTHYQPLVERMMAKDRSERFQDTDTLVDMLDERVRTDEVHGTVISASSHRRRRRPHRSGVSLFARRWFAILLFGMSAAATGFAGAWLYSESLQSKLVVSGPSEASLALDSPVLTAPPATLPRATGPTATEAAPQTGAVSRDDVIKALEWLARHSLENDRLTHPPADNAYYYYSRLLALDPDHAAARRGFTEIAERYVVLAEKEYSRSNTEKAQLYVALGLQVDPEHEGLRQLMTFIQQPQRSWWDALLEIFSSG